MTGKTRRSRRFTLLALALTVALTAAARADEPPPIKTLVPGTLKVCLYPGFAPFASQDAEGNWQGWDVDFLEAFAKQNNLTFEVVSRNFEGIWLEPGKANAACDIAGTGISDTKDRRKATGRSAVWSNTYYHVLRTFLVRTQDFARLTKVEDLRGKKAVVTKGSTANSDLCYRMKQGGIHPCKKYDGDHPCSSFDGLADFAEMSREQDPSCVFIEYPWAQDEKNAAADISLGRDSDQDPTFPFTYGGGYGSIQDLVCNCQKDCASSARKPQDLATVWPHCNMTWEDGKDDPDFPNCKAGKGGSFEEYAEPFSFVVRSADMGLAHALNCYINSHPYPGTPIPELGCTRPCWVPEQDTKNCPVS